MKKLLPEERARLIEDICEGNALGHESIGASIRRLRLEVTGLDQETFAKMCKMSTRTLYDLESGKSNPTLSTLDAVLRHFGLRIGLMGLSGYSKTKPPSVGGLGMGLGTLTSPTSLPAAGNYKTTSPLRGRSPAVAKAKKGTGKTSAGRRIKGDGDDSDRGR